MPSRAQPLWFSQWIHCGLFKDNCIPPGACPNVSPAWPGAHVSGSTGDKFCPEGMSAGKHSVRQGPALRSYGESVGRMWDEGFFPLARVSSFSVSAWDPLEGKGLAPDAFLPVWQGHRAACTLSFASPALAFSHSCCYSSSCALV